MPRRIRQSADRVDSDRIGRMDARRHREPSVNSQIARRLRGFKGGKTKRFGGAAGFSSHGARQRVVVKALVSRHKAGNSRGSLTRHVSYLGRESASPDGKRGVFYDAASEGVNAKQEAAQWANDRHHFRLIVSPEHGAAIPDMIAYVWEVMKRVQRDLDSKLQWIAVNHHNTDNPHAHILLRGRRGDGTDLVIPRQYISYGIRDRACEVATELLGERSSQEVQLAKSKEVEAERFTSLDRMIERHLENGTLDLSVPRRIGFRPHDRTLVVGRLLFLEKMDLAQKGRGTTWHLEEGFKQALRELGNRNDIIAHLYSSLGSEAGRVERMIGGVEPSVPVAGIMIAKGSPDEIGEDRFIVLRDKAGQAHYGRVRDGGGFRDLNIGSVAEMGAGTRRRQLVAEQITAVANANRGIWSAELHATYLCGAKPDSTEQETTSSIQSAAARLKFVAGFQGSGVRTLPDGQFKIDTTEFERFSRRGSQRTDVRVIAEHSLEEQIEARALTWLDRQAFSEQPDMRTAEHPEVREAIERRSNWLVANGYAARQQQGGTAIELVPGALGQLAAEERSSLEAKLMKKYGRPVEELPNGGSVEGKYHGTEHLHSGKLAAIVTDDAVFVSPVTRSPDIAAGSEVRLQRFSARNTAMELTAGPAIDIDMGLSLDGPGGTA
jgi:type IV secretory pathway VirD2 relaxase